MCLKQIGNTWEGKCKIPSSSKFFYIWEEDTSISYKSKECKIQIGDTTTWVGVEYYLNHIKSCIPHDLNSVHLSDEITPCEIQWFCHYARQGRQEEHSEVWKLTEVVFPSKAKGKKPHWPS